MSLQNKGDPNTDLVAPLAAHALLDGAFFADRASAELGESGTAQREEDGRARGIQLSSEWEHQAAQLARQVLHRRLRRLDHFGPELAQDGVWNMLLELVIARAQGKLVPIKCLWLSSGVPQSTALRWVNWLQARGHVERRNDPTDRRRQFIRIGDDLAFEMNVFLSATES